MGLLFFLYGCLSFNLSLIVIGLILIWIGSGIYGTLLEAQREAGQAPGQHCS